MTGGMRYATMWQVAALEDLLEWMHFESGLGHEELYRLSSLAADMAVTQVIAAMGAAHVEGPGNKDPGAGAEAITAGKGRPGTVMAACAPHRAVGYIVRFSKSP